MALHPVGYVACLVAGCSLDLASVDPSEAKLSVDLLLESGHIEQGVTLSLSACYDPGTVAVSIPRILPSDSVTVLGAVVPARYDEDGCRGPSWLVALDLDEPRLDATSIHFPELIGERRLGSFPIGVSAEAAPRELWLAPGEDLELLVETAAPAGGTVNWTYRLTSEVNPGFGVALSGTGLPPQSIVVPRGWLPEVVFPVVGRLDLTVLEERVAVASGGPPAASIRVRAQLRHLAVGLIP